MKVTVLVDSREKRPLKFPSTIKWYQDRCHPGTNLLIRSKPKTLTAGDYALEGYEETCIVERKGSLTELASNLLGDDYVRAMGAFERLSSATTHPYLLVECSAAELRTRTKHVHEPGRVVDALAALIERHNLRLILVGRCNTITQKRTVGEMILRLMLAHAYQKQEEDYSECDTVIQKLRSRLEPNGTPPKGRGDPPSSARS